MDLDVWGPLLLAITAVAVGAIVNHIWPRRHIEESGMPDESWWEMRQKAKIEMFDAQIKASKAEAEKATKDADKSKTQSRR